MRTDSVPPVKPRSPARDVEAECGRVLCAFERHAFDRLDHEQLQFCSRQADVLTTLGAFLAAVEAAVPLDGDAFDPQPRPRGAGPAFDWSCFLAEVQPLAKFGQDIHDYLINDLPPATAYLIRLGEGEEDDEAEEEDEDEDAGEAPTPDTCLVWSEAIRALDTAERAVKALLHPDFSGSDAAERINADASAWLHHIRLYLGTLDAEAPPAVKRLLEADAADEPDVYTDVVDVVEADVPELVS